MKIIFFFQKYVRYFETNTNCSKKALPARYKYFSNETLQNCNDISFEEKLNAALRVAKEPNKQMPNKVISMKRDFKFF